MLGILRLILKTPIQKRVFQRFQNRNIYHQYQKWTKLAFKITNTGDIQNRKTRSEKKHAR